VPLSTIRPFDASKPTADGAAGCHRRAGARLAAFVLGSLLVLLAPRAHAEGLAAFSTMDNNCTGEKPQSKLWFHDGSFWAVVQGPEGVAIYERIGTAWVRANSMDGILGPTGQADVKWDGTHLFVLLYANNPQLFKYTWDGTLRIWNLVTGFPVAVPRPSGAETMVLELDSTGRLWATAEGAERVAVYYTTSADHRTWSGSMTLQSGISTDDISSVVAFGGDRIGVFWSDQVRDEFGFRIHHDGADPAVWDSVEIVDKGVGYADDHIHLTADSSGRIYAITKNAYDQLQVHRRDTTGQWTTVRDIAGGHSTRGFLMVSDADQKVYALYTRWPLGTNPPPDPIEYRVADVADLAFGPSVTLMSATSGLNNVTGTKQILPAGTLCAMAAGGGKVWWNGWPAIVDPSQPPAAPPNLTAVMQTLPLRTTLQWLQPPTGPVDGYDVYLKLDSGAPQKLNTELVTTNSYTQLQPPLGGLCYHVVAVKDSLRSPTSNTACVSNQEIAPPGMPENVVVTPVLPGATDGALTLWFDAGAGQSVVDVSGHGNDAHLGTSTTGTDSQDPTWTAGIAGSALRFDGVNDNVHVSDAGSLDMDGSFTFEAWVLRTNTKRGTIVYKGTSGARTYSVAITTSGAVEFAWDTRTGQARMLTSPTLAVAANSGWRHLACVYDAAAGENRIYVDGTLRAIGGSTTGQPAFNAAALYVGVRFSSGSVKDPFAGSIDGLRIRAGAHYSSNFTPVANPAAVSPGVPQSMLVQWQPPVAGGAVGGYLLDRTANGGAPLGLNAQPAQNGVYTDEVVPAAAICYRVTALNTQGNPGPPSAPACADLRVTPPPAPPQAVTAQLTSEPGRARIAWRAAETGPPAAAYAVHRRSNAGAFAVLGTVPAPDTTLVDSTLVAGAWCYFVRALDAEGLASAASDTACVDYAPPPTIGAPLNPTATPADSVIAGNATGAVILSFDEGAGQTTMDASGNGNHAMLGSSDAADSADPVWLAGLAGSAVRLDGSNDRLKIADSPSLRLNGSFTVEAWVRRASTGTEDCIASKGDSSKRNFYVMLTADGRIDFTWETSGGVKHGLTSTATVADNNWHHIACVYDQANGQSRIFLDGSLLQWAADTGTPVGSIDPMYVGARLTAGSLKSYFHGTIDLLRTVPSALYADHFTPPTSYRATTTQRITRLQWQPPALGSAAGYRAYRQDAGAAFVAIGPPSIAGTSFTDMSPPEGVACYRITALDSAGSEGPPSDTACTSATKVQENGPREPVAPAGIALSAAPNPFNPTTVLRFALPQATDVSLVIYDARGTRVVTVVRGALPAGRHAVIWTGRTDSGSAAASGVYFARLQAGTAAKSAKLLLLK
jgi:hypothetical protein